MNSKKTLTDKQNWDAYWNKKDRQNYKLYDIIASFYRRFIIKPSLSYYLKKIFNKNSLLLHAGCGSGQVDKDLLEFFYIHAMDISTQALICYKNSNQDCSNHKIFQGSIFEIPIKDESYDGIYNLGVMEHFYEQDLKKILKEFHKILKPEAYLVLFWPPEFGLSVIVLKFVHIILNNVFNLNIKLHPDEFTRIKSIGKTRKLLQNCGFELCSFNFSFRDFFTHAIIIAKKVS